MSKYKDVDPILVKDHLVSLRPIDFSSLSDFEAIVSWYKDPLLRPLVTVNFNDGKVMMPTEPLELKHHKEAQDTNQTYMILMDGKVVGDISIDTAFPMLCGDKEACGWLGICVGEAYARGLGAGYGAMKLIEEVARVMGLKRLELGVFAYNHKAISFYERLGYTRFETVVDFTYHEGTWHDDYRMEKYI